MPNIWWNLLGLVILSMQYGLRIDLPIFLNLFYLKLCKKGRFTFYAWRKVQILEDAPTFDKRWKNKYFFVKNEGLFSPVRTFDSGIRLAWSTLGNFYSSEAYIGFAAFLTEFLSHSARPKQ